MYLCTYIKTAKKNLQSTPELYFTTDLSEKKEVFFLSTSSVRCLQFLVTCEECLSQLHYEKMKGQKGLMTCL
jgi:hypothetical protein